MKMNKKMSKKKKSIKLPIILVVSCALMMVLMFTLSSVLVTAATVASGNGTWISGKLTYTWEATSNGTTSNGATGSVSVSNNTLTVTATNSKEVSGCSTTAAEATTTTVTVTNASSYPIEITTLTTGGSASVSGISLGDTIASGATFKVTVTAPAVSSSTKVSGTVAIAVEEQTSVTITLAASPYVGYTVNGTSVSQNGSDQTFTTTPGTTISLPSITAPSGYEFKGWRVGSTMTTASSFTADASFTIFPVIVTAGTNTTAENFKVGSTTYTFWEDAVTAAVSGDGKMFLNLTDVTLPNNVLDNLLPASGGTYVKPVTGGRVEYILPAGVTLVVPYSTSTTVHTTTPAYDYKQRVTPSPFRTLTVPSGAKITVNGSVSVDSFVCAYGQSNQGNGTPSGPHGKIVMKSGSEMALNSGANLYCYGYINGDGNIYVNSGAKVYELFQFCDWRGGNGTNNINGNSQRVFPMSQYYVQNVEAPMTIYKGATEMVWSVVNMSSDAYPTSPIEFIGSNGMFKLTGSSSDYVMKRYHANVDRLEITAHGDMSLNNLTVKVSGLPLIGTITMNSNAYVLPLNNMNIVVESGTTSIASGQTYGVAFLPSSKLTVNEGATFTANAPVYLYDSDDWGGYCGASNAKLVVSGYSTANGTTTMRTADNLKDAEFDVNGTVNVSNKLYTTPKGANITSSAGTGVINFTTACATTTATTHQATQSGTDISYVDITVNNAWLKNGDESYSYTVGTGTSTWHYHKPGEHWYRYLVDFKYNSNTIAYGYYCENDDTVTYDASWLTGLGASVTSGSATAAISGTDVNVTNVTADSVVTLTGTPAEYIPTFVLNEKQYSIYQSYTGNTLSETTTIGGKTYYIVNQASSALAVGTTYAAPTNAVMGVTAANHNSITWNMSGLSYTSGDPFLGTVPAGETAQGPVYIYGFYTGVVAHNSWNDQYYDTLIGAFEVLPQDVSATITLLADCGTFEDESGTVAYTAYPSNNITLNLNGYHATGRIVSSGTFTLELNGGTLDYHTGATAAAATYKGLATIINSGTMTIQDSVGGGMIISDATCNSSGSDGSAVIRNNKGATLSITGKASDDLLTIKENQTEVAYNSSYGYYAYNYGIYNLGKITALTNVDITTAHSRTVGVNVYNYNTGVIDLISGGHMYCYSGSSIFNYGGKITTIDGVTIDGKNGITNRNIRGGAIASGYTVANADIGTIGTITNCHIEVGQYAINNNAKITTLSNSTLIAHPDSAQVDTRGNGLSTASEGNTYCYTIYNSGNWWYDTNVWKQVDSTSGGYTRVNYYKEEEQYRPSIGTITSCTIYAENTGNSAAYGYALYNTGGIIGKIDGTNNIKTYKHPDNTAISVSYYGMHNVAGGIIKSIEGTVNVSATGIGTVYNDGQFTLQNNYTYANKVAGNITYQKNTYGEPSTINSITCSGTWSCGGSSSYYYALMNSGYIGTINSTGLTLTGGYNVMYNATGSANKTYEITKKYTDGATASTEYERDTHYVKNLEKGSTIGTVNGIKINVRGTKVYQGLNNQGHIGTLSNVTVGFADGATNNTSSYPLVLNGDSRYQSYTETILTNRTADTDPHLTVSSGIVTRYDRDYTYTTPPTIDVIDNLTVTSIGTYAFRNAGHIGTMKNSTITGTQYSLHNYAAGPYTERQTRQYYSGTGIFTTTKNAGELNKHYKRNPAVIDLIDNCTITTPANTYAMFNSGHVGTIKNSTLTAGTTTAKAYALANSNSQEREYTRDLESILYVTAKAGTSCTAYYGSGGESDVVTYDYDVPVIDLIGEGNTFKATAPVITNTGIITEINSGEGTKTEITESAAKYYAIYNYSCVLDTRTTTTPYTAATAASTSGTKGTAVNEDVNQPGAQIGTIKNVYIDSNGYGILNGDASTGKLPTIGEIGAGTEIYAHCTTAGYHAIYNQANAKITSITGGLFKVTKATTNAFKNNSTDAANATLISGGDFQGASNTRANAIFEPDNTARQTYPEGKKLSTITEDPTETNANMSGDYYFINSNCSVTFNVQGHGTAPDAQTIESGLKATLPDAPAVDSIITEDGKKYRFDGWYKEAGCSNVWDFDTETVAANTELFAKWTQVYTVTFNANGQGTAPDAQNIEYDGLVTEPTAPTATGYTFGGWYKEAECENPWDFSADKVTADTELFAKWTINTYTVTFDKNGQGTAPPSQTIAYGGLVTEPTAPTTTAYNFGGWYKESGCTNKWDFATDTVTADTTLYAKWTVKTFYAYYYNRYYDSTGSIPAPSSSTYANARKSMSYSSSNTRATLSSASTSLVTADLDQKYTYSELVGWYVTTYNSSTKKYTPVYDTAQSAVTAAQITPEFLNQKAEEGKYTALGGKIKVTSAIYIFAVYRIASTKEYAITMYDASAANAEITADSAGYKDVTASVQYGERASAPAKTNTAQYSYTYTGWSTAAEYEAASDKTAPAHTASEQLNVVYTAQSYYFYYTSATNKYDITWLDGDGNTLKTEQVTYGQTPSYTGDTPTKTATAQYTYTFAGWSDSQGGEVIALPEVTGADTYYAVFTETVNTYAITWVDGDGETLKTEQVAYGETPAFTGDAPIKDSSVLIGWDYSYTPFGTDQAVTGHVNTTSSGTPRSDSDKFPAVVADLTMTPVFKAQGENDIFISHSLTATGSLGVNFYLDLETFAANQVDLTGAYLTFSWGTNKYDGNDPHGPYTQRTDISLYSGYTYKGTVTVAAKELNDLITVKLYLKNGTECATHEYHASDYLYKVIADENNDLAGKLFPNDEDADTKLGLLQDLCKSMLSYAASAQVNFGYNTEDLADARKNNNKYILSDAERHDSITRDASIFADYDATDVDGGYLLKGTTLDNLGLSFYGFSVLLESETSYRLYYSNPSGSLLDLSQITLPDNVKMSQVNNGKYYTIDIINLPAATLTDDITLSIITNTGTDTLKVNLCSYFYSILSGTNENLKCAVSNLCNYSAMAKTFFETVNVGGNND